MGNDPMVRAVSMVEDIVVVVQPYVERLSVAVIQYLVKHLERRSPVFDVRPF